MPKGNPNRCKRCNGLASGDGYCKNCRVEAAREYHEKHPVSPFRKNWKELGFGFTKMEDKKEFGVCQDFGINRRW